MARLMDLFKRRPSLADDLYRSINELQAWCDQYRAAKHEARADALEEAAKIAEQVGKNHPHAAQLAGHIAYQIRAAAPEETGCPHTVLGASHLDQDGVWFSVCVVCGEDVVPGQRRE